MAIYLVRHARAESRSAWTDGDTSRPLTPEGHDQAREIAATWSFGAPVAVWSSPRLRCVQTVEPLAARFGLSVGIEPFLEEDTPFERVLPLLEAAGLDPTARAETVPVEGFVRLANAWGATRL